jgi:hypothetical protein
MRSRLLKAGIVALAVLGGAVIPASAAGTPNGASFPGGSLVGLAINGTFTEGSFQSFAYHFEGCGSEPAEETCTWEVRLHLSSNPARRCVPSTPESQQLWDSGQQSGNRAVEVGPLDFALEGCEGQILGAYYQAEKRFNPEEEEGAWKLIANRWMAPLFSIEIGTESHNTIEEPTVGGSPSLPPFSLNISPLPKLAISGDCRSLKIGSTRYAFVFRRMTCHKAANLATVVYLSNRAPNGYACESKHDGGKRCWRHHQPQEFLEWHLTKRSARATKPT